MRELHSLQFMIVKSSITSVSDENFYTSSLIISWKSATKTYVKSIFKNIKWISQDYKYSSYLILYLNVCDYTYISIYLHYTTFTLSRDEYLKSSSVPNFQLLNIYFDYLSCVSKFCVACRLLTFSIVKLSMEENQCHIKRYDALHQEGRVSPWLSPTLIFLIL